MAKKDFSKNFKAKGLTDSIENQKKKLDQQIKKGIIVLKELQELIPPLSQEEFGLLETSISEEGCRDPLVLWEKENDYVLVDGHNRFAICSQHKIDFDYIIKDFDTIDDVRDWMVSNQLGKRNVTNETKAWLRGMQYNREKGKHGGDRRSNKAKKKTVKKIDVIDGKEKEVTLSTDERLAEMHKVSPKTIQRDEKYALSLEALTRKNRELRRKILQRELPIPKSFIEDISEYGEVALEKMGKLIAEGTDYKVAQVKCKDLATSGKIPKPYTTKLDKMTEEEKEIWRKKNKLKADLTRAINAIFKNKTEEDLKHFEELYKEMQDFLFKK